MNPVVGIAISLVPELLKVISGDNAEQIGRKITDAVAEATKSRQPEDAAKKIFDDPKIRADLQARLAQIALEAQRVAFEDAQKQRDADAKADESSNRNTSDARATLERLVSASPLLQLTPAILSYIVVTGFMVTLGLLAAGFVKLDTRDPNVFQVVNILIGALAAAFATVLNFWLGSSLGSRRKDAMLEFQSAQPTPSAPPPVPAPTPAPAAPQPAPTPSRIEDADDEGAAPAPRGEARPAPAAKPAPHGLLAELLPELTKTHRHFPQGASWQMTADGIAVDGAAPTGTAGQPVTVTEIWKHYGEPCAAAARKFGVPVELIVATIATESAGKPDARRAEPQIHDESVGLMQTLVTTARAALGRPKLQGDDLLDPATSIEAGTAYIAQQRSATHFDPPLVAAAYNAGSIRLEDADANRWRLCCYPKGTGRHIDHFVAFFADAMKVAAAQDWSAKGATPSFVGELSGLSPAVAPSAGAPTPTGAEFPPRPAFPPLVTTAQRQQLFGAFSFVADPQPGNREHIRITDDWAETNIIDVSIPVKHVAGKDGPLVMPFHRLAADQLVALWLEWERKGLLDRIVSFDGAFVPRFVRGSTTSLSNHAFGTAFDINAEFNNLGRTPAAVGAQGSVRELVPIANELGFFWGGHYNHRLDGMHFEVAKLLGKPVS